MTDRGRHIVLMVVLFGLAAGLRLYGLSWGLPEIYEEAMPLRKAWAMWGFGPGQPFDLNPHFFNYPSLSIYLQLLAQAILFPLLRITGVAPTEMDLRLLYLFDPTWIVLAGRIITALFGAGTVVLAFRAGKRAGGPAAGAIAALLLAVNPFHIAKSQVIEVDVPLTFFTMAALLLLDRARESPTLRRSIAAGIVAGLAVSTKYTAALLGPVLLAAFFLAGSAARSRRGFVAGIRLMPWKSVAAASAAAILAFAFTSPFVLLDRQSFVKAMTLESEHMSLGHFGGAEAPAGFFYLGDLGSRILGWPTTLLGVGGLLFFAFRKRAPWPILMFLFAAAYAAVLASWRMTADRYALPLLPILMTAAAAAAVTLVESRVSSGGGKRAAIIAAVGLGLALQPLGGYAEILRRNRPDTRSLARAWIETHLPQGSFVVMESYGPKLLSPLDIKPLEEEMRARVLDDSNARPMYAVQLLPMFQVKPERSSIYYLTVVHPEVDYVVTTSDIRDRYEEKPGEFPVQTAFYRDLDARFEKIMTFEPAGRTGPEITIYRNPAHDVPFGERKTVTGPVRLGVSEPGISGDEGFWFYSLGVNYLTYGHPDEALAALRYGFTFQPLRPDVYRNLVIEITANLRARGLVDETLNFLDEAMAGAPSEHVRRAIGELRIQMTRRS